MSSVASAFDGHGWTSERLERLSREELANLQANAERLGEPALAALCTQILKDRPRRGGNGSVPDTLAKARRGLVPRSRAFEARGVWLQDARTSWGGVRKSDGKVVMALWHAAVKPREGGCACLLWAPNTEGKRPWSDTAAGRERLEHCKLALAGEGAEGLFVYGQALDGKLPEERARTILGIDPQTVVHFKVELRDGQYWAVWGKKPPA
jgi:hypothetical protein